MLRRTTSSWRFGARESGGGACFPKPARWRGTGRGHLLGALPAGPARVPEGWPRGAHRRRSRSGAEMQGRSRAGGRRAAGVESVPTVWSDCRRGPARGLEFAEEQSCAVAARRGRNRRDSMAAQPPDERRRVMVGGIVRPRELAGRGRLQHPMAGTCFGDHGSRVGSGRDVARAGLQAGRIDRLERAHERTCGTGAYGRISHPGIRMELERRHAGRGGREQPFHLEHSSGSPGQDACTTRPPDQRACFAARLPAGKQYSGRGHDRRGPRVIARG